MKNTTNFNFKKPEVSDVINPDDFNENSDSIDKILFNSSRMEEAQGTANEITLTNITFENGDIKNFIAKSNNNGSSTTINGKNVYRAGTNEPPTFIEKKAYTVWYDLSGDCFFTKANAEGTAIASQVLAGTTFSNNIDTNIQGELPTNSYINSALNCGESITIPYGFIPGGTVKANSLASQTSATAESNKVLNGYTFWRNGTRYTGNIPFLQAQTITPGTSNKTINPGVYINGPQTIKGDPNLIASNIISGKSIFGITGTATAKSLLKSGYISSLDAYYDDGNANHRKKYRLQKSLFEFVPTYIWGNLSYLSNNNRYFFIDLSHGIGILYYDDEQEGSHAVRAYKCIRNISFDSDNLEILHTYRNQYTTPGGSGAIKDIYYYYV